MSDALAKYQYWQALHAKAKAQAAQPALQRLSAKANGGQAVRPAPRTLAEAIYPHLSAEGRTEGRRPG
jgi:hypothetical protein